MIVPAAAIVDPGQGIDGRQAPHLCLSALPVAERPVQQPGPEQENQCQGNRENKDGDAKPVDIRKSISRTDLGEDGPPDPWDRRVPDQFGMRLRRLYEPGPSSPRCSD